MILSFFKLDLNEWGAGRQPSIGNRLTPITIAAPPQKLRRFTSSSSVVAIAFDCSVRVVVRVRFTPSASFSALLDGGPLRRRCYFRF
ncbi:hypothetical protein JJD41_23510 [Oxynema sp. CENA135]|uniref:hypothetical protein n=1 Tax=Oxynema sp. CENA135 TaxID=984206 RepID=UPI00190C6198|nr:hypothetical protein [Oxynema sp. CENA135]MBK4732811.1 hypothetical protein [Oxynema sp. CENA135]